MSQNKRIKSPILCLILSLLLTVAAVSPSLADAVPELVYVTTQKMQLRQEKDLLSATVGEELPLLSELTVLEKDGEWLLASYEGTVGYIMLYFVSEYVEQTTLERTLVYNAYDANAEQPGALVMAYPLSWLTAYVLGTYENGQQLVLLPEIGGQKGFIWPGENPDFYGQVTDVFRGKESVKATVVKTCAVYRQPTFIAVVQGSDLEALTEISCTEPVGAWVYVPEREGYIPVGAVQYAQVDVARADGNYFVNAFSELNPEGGFGTGIAYRPSELAIITGAANDCARVILDNDANGFLIEKYSDTNRTDWESVERIIADAYNATQYQSGWLRYDGVTGDTPSRNAAVYYTGAAKENPAQVLADAFVVFDKTDRNSLAVSEMPLDQKMIQAVRLIADAQTFIADDGISLIDIKDLYSLRAQRPYAHETDLAEWQVSGASASPNMLSITPFIVRNASADPIDDKIYLYINLITDQADIGWICAEDAVVAPVTALLSGRDDIADVWLGLAGNAASEDYAFDMDFALGTVTITGSGSVHVRAGDGTDYASLGKVKPGDTFLSVGQADTGWYKIALDNGQIGFVSPKVVELHATNSSK